MNADPRKLLKYYERGVLTRIELVTHLIETASEHPPEEWVKFIPADVLSELRQRVLDADLENGVYIWGGTLHPNVDANKFRVEMERQWNDGCRNWRRYFVTTD